MSDLTKEFLHQRFSYCPVDIGKPLVYRENAASNARKGDPCGTLHQGYYQVRLLGKPRTMHRVVWLYKHPGCYKYSEVPPLLDHINRNAGDNRFENLRQASYRLNNFNQNKRLKSTSSFRGVWFDRNRKWNKWQGRLKRGEKREWRSSFDTEIEAALAWDREAYKEWGRDAVPILNFPEKERNYMGLDEWRQLEFSFCDDSPAQQILDFDDVALLC